MDKKRRDLIKGGAALAGGALSSAAPAAQWEYREKPGSLFRKADYRDTKDLWSFYMDLLKENGDILDYSAYGDSQETAGEGADFLFTALSTAYIVCYNADPDYPQFVPLCNQVIRFGAPNPDVTYYIATITGDGTYRFFGNVNTIYAVDWQTGYNYQGFGDKPGETFPTRRLHDYDINPDGSFEILMSEKRPAGHKGNWLKLDPKANFILLRIIAYRPDEINPHLAIERLDSQGPIKPFSPEDMDQRVRRMLRWMQIDSRNYAAAPKRQKEKGNINRLERINFGVGEVQGQIYYEGLWNLEDDEALLIEVEISKCFYWNIQLSDLVWRTLDFVNRQSSINGYKDRADSDGITRIVVSARDPGVENWADTVGHKEGDILMRWIEAEKPPVPKATKILLKDLDNYLPKDTKRVTPEQRQAALRARRAGYQLRHHGW